MKNTTEVEAGVVELVDVDTITDPEKDLVFEDYDNPYLKNGLTHFERNTIRKMGSPFQKRWLAELERGEKTKEQIAYEKKLQLPKVDREIDPDLKFKKANAKMMRKIMGKPERTFVPAEVYPAARMLLYNAYSSLVYQRTSARPIIKLGDSTSNALALTAHWLVDAEEWMGEGEPKKCWDIRKSLYFCGPPGNGKSTIALAASIASEQLYNEYGTFKRLAYKSMNQVKTDIMVSGNLEPLKTLATGGLVIDELRLEHLSHRHYGNDIDILADTLLHRWESWNYQSQQTIITTNITPSELAENIADDKDRVRSRIKDQFALVKFTAPSFRDSKMIEYDL